MEASQQTDDRRSGLLIFYQTLAFSQWIDLYPTFSIEDFASR